MEDENERENEFITETSQMKSMGVIMDVAKSVCIIQYKNHENKIINGTGFFIQLQRNNNPLFCLITNEHVIPKNILISETQINISYDNQNEKTSILLGREERFIRDYTYLNIDAVIIEILPIDNVQKKYFLFPYIDYNEGLGKFKDKEISIVQYPGGKDLNFSEGKIIDINDYSNEMSYDSSTERGSSGSPIFLKDSRNVLGIHKQGNKTKKKIMEILLSL